MLCICICIFYSSNSLFSSSFFFFTIVLLPILFICWCNNRLILPSLPSCLLPPARLGNIFERVISQRVIFIFTKPPGYFNTVHNIHRTIQLSCGTILGRGNVRTLQDPSFVFVHTPLASFFFAVPNLPRSPIKTDESKFKDWAKRFIFTRPMEHL